MCRNMIKNFRILQIDVKFNLRQVFFLTIAQRSIPTTILYIMKMEPENSQKVNDFLVPESTNYMKRP